MIERIKQESLNVLTDTLMIGLEDNTPRPAFPDKAVSRKYCLQVIRTHQQDLKENFPEALEECKVAYQEITALTDREFEILYQELLSIRVTSS